MRQALRAVRAAGQWFAAALVLLLAVLTTATPAPSAPAGPTSPSALASPTAPTAHSASPRADDSCAFDCAVHVLVRQGHPGERPTLPEHHATDPRDPALLPAQGTYAPAPSAYQAASPGRSAHDRDRAPPASTGI
ncbi:hypothetical protein [Streptomyces sp. MA5143a]|uniref:hypothetical protein n=1 Tax=Streptomyces sp. MA5143a TaxID=2083010 RepID=UPI000D1AD6B0|nr:hypothetical protein [Streptomyces sp. MA5143a]SPF02694.1 hypothetical protein SMA5143A_3452 [Streptomyces sp. MA5143a]